MDIDDLDPYLENIKIGDFKDCCEKLDKLLEVLIPKVKCFIQFLIELMTQFFVNDNVKIDDNIEKCSSIQIDCRNSEIIEPLKKLSNPTNNTKFKIDNEEFNVQSSISIQCNPNIKILHQCE